MKQINVKLFDERWYEVEPNVFYPSVTHMLGQAYPKDDFLAKWRGDVGNEVAGKALKDGGKVGSYVHETIETMILKGTKFKTADIVKEFDGDNTATIKVLKSLVSFVAFWEKYEPQVVECEYKVSSSELRLAGTVDGKYRLNIDDYKTVWGLDWKTSKAIHDINRVQLSLYKAMDEEIDQIAIVHLGNATKAGYSFLEVNQEKGYYEQGVLANNMFQAMYPNAKPSTNVFPESFSITNKKIS